MGDPSTPPEDTESPTQTRTNPAGPTTPPPREIDKSTVTASRSTDSDDGTEGGEDDEGEEDEEETEPTVKYTKLTGSLTSVYRNGDSTSAALVAADKLVRLRYDVPIESRAVLTFIARYLGRTMAIL